MSNPKHSAEQNSLLHKRYYKGACQRTWMWLVLYFVMLCSKLPLVVSSSRGSVCTGPSLFLIRASPVPSRGCTCYNALCYQPIGSLALKCFPEDSSDLTAIPFLSSCFESLILFLMIYTLRAFIDLRIDLKAFQIHHPINRTLLFSFNTMKPAKR